MTSDELWEKFYDCARRALSKHDVLPLFERLETLEKVGDIGDVMRLLASRPRPGAALGAMPGRAAVSAATVPAGNTLLETSWVP